MVHGGDGIAFVLQNHDNGTQTIGQNGEHLGYGGISNSIAIELDTWDNQNNADMYWDHISIHSSGRYTNSAHEHARLNVPIRKPLADGKVHEIQISYYNEVKVYLKINSLDDQV